MVGIPLMNLGTALGGLAQGWNQSQDTALRQAIQRLALQQQQQQAGAQTLAGLGLQAGLLNNQPMSPITNSPQLPPAQPQPPMPGQASVPTPQQVYNAGGNVDGPPSATSWPPSNMPSQAGTPAPGVPIGTTFPPPPDQDTPRIPNQRLLTAPPPSPPATPDQASAAGFPEGGAAVPADSGYGDPGTMPFLQRRAANNLPVQQQGDTKGPAGTESGRGNDSGPPASDSTLTISRDKSDSSGAGGTPSLTFPNGQSMPIPDFFRSVDTTKIAQGLAKLAPPGTDPAEIYEATAALLKLSSGNKEEQIQAALLGKALGGQYSLARTEMQVQGRHEDTQTRAATQQTIATGNQQTRLDVANISAQTRLQVAQMSAQARADLEVFKQSKIDVRSKARLDQGAARMQQAAQNAQTGTLAKEISGIRAQMSAVKPDAGGNYTDEQQQQLKGYADQLAQINQKLAAVGSQPTAP
jgi:hypothetical protein